MRRNLNEARQTPSAPTAALGGLIAMAAAIGIGRFAYTPILPVMVEALGLTGTQAGLIASANFLGYLSGSLLAAVPRLPGSPRTWLVGALALSAATTGAMGLVSEPWLFLLLRLLGGLGSAVALVLSTALVLSRLAEAGRAELSAVHFGGVGLGIALSAVMVWALMGTGAGWRELWIACAALSLAAVPAVLRLVPEAPTPRSLSAAVEHPGGNARRDLRRLVAAYGLFGFGYVITATFLVAIVRGGPGTQSLEALVWIVVGLTAAPSVAFWTWIGGRIGVSRAFAAACLLEAAGVCGSVLWSSGPSVLAAAAGLGGTFMGLTALGLTGAQRLSGGDPRGALALMSAGFGVGQITGPAFAGLAHDATGSYFAPSLVAAAALVLAAALAARTRV